MIKLGAITIDVSHPLAFAKTLSEGERDRYTTVYNNGFRESDETQSFADRFGLKICSSVDELANQNHALNAWF